MAIDKIGSAAITDSAVTDAKLSFNANQFRNIIINGDMSIAQRGTSHTTASGYTLDRWHLNDSTSGAFTVTQSTTVPSGQGFASSYKLDCTTADASPSSSEYLIFNQRIEGQNLQYIKKGTSSAESLTLSFWVRSNKTGDYVAELRDADNTRNNTIKYTISSADTWEKKTLTFAADTSGALDNDNARSFDVNFWLLAGSTFSSGTFSSNTWSSITDANRAAGGINIADSTSNEWYITGVQLETGTSASDFEFLPVDANLQRCKRYFNAFFTENNMVIFQYQGGFRALYYPYPIAMRSSPTLSVGTFVNFSAFNGSLASTTGIYAYENVSSTDTNSYAVGDCELNAEL